MSRSWQSALDRWLAAGLLDGATTARIRQWEEGQAGRGSSRGAMIAFGLGGLLVMAGVLLFVASHWDDLSPLSRFLLVLAMVGAFHAGGAAATRNHPALATTLHAVGTATLGAGIYLSGQVFHMAEHWPGALLLWSLGAAAGYWLLRDWPHALWLALLVPAWLLGEWVEAQVELGSRAEVLPATVGTFLLAASYAMARSPGHDSASRRALAWLGAAGLIPLAQALGFARMGIWPGHEPAGHGAALVLAWAVAIGLPLGLGCWLRGRDALFLLPVLAWALVVSQVDGRGDAGELGLYALFAVGAVGLVLWGLRDAQAVIVNIGMAGFALTVVVFYFSSVYDKLDRSLALIGAGVVFIGGGWLLERMRRRLLTRIRGGA